MKQVSKAFLFLIAGFLWFMPIPGLAADSTAVFTVNALLRQITTHHPVARQAALLSEQAKQEIRMARGSFDPSAAVKVSNKELDDKHYYTLWDNVLKVPLWVGDIKVGYERNTGPNVNGENSTPTQGLHYVGFSLPLAQGLLIDERRATLQLAQQAQALAETERVKLINKLYFEAAKAYWDWAYSYHRWRLLQEGSQLAQVRLQAIKERVIQGDLASIDSVEALIEAQSRLVSANQAQVETQNAALLVSNFLWRENNVPVEIPGGVVPSMVGTEIEVLSPAALADLLETAGQQHPELLKLEVKLNQLDIERRFAQNKLLPKVNLDYNLLGKGTTVGEGWLQDQYFRNNYKIGASVSMPLFLRQERGKLQLTRLKVTSTQLELTQRRRETQNQIQATYNDRLQLETQLALQEQVVANSLVLRNGEQQRFENGESSVFLVNTREMNLLNQQIKLYELKAKYGKAKYLLQWAAGRLTEGN
ncbi:TolC family protein [Rufibacter sp. LB8]|uniref:TolC family protein n=1 Tax=Rufibacter sp. LB8 TaxID=2777781 RepID=UPI00178C60BC|nr:TolC family protein [Rufibacter sp. LB8]